MKVLCNACEAAEARVMCCADEAALCWACDERVHAANKLAGKHLRVPLISSSDNKSSDGGGGATASVPKCDICQEASGYFFCLEDRALLCRNCDVTIHSANNFVSSHQRFLLTGIQVALESTENPNLNPNPNSKPVPPPVKSFERSSSMSGQTTWESNYNNNNLTDALPHTLPDWPVINTQQQYSSDLANKRNGSNNMVCNSVQAGREGGGTANKNATGGGLFSGNTPDWPLDEFFGFREYNNSGFGFTEHGSSKADSGKLGSSEGSSLYRTNDEDLDANYDSLGQVPEISSWTVPEMRRSPPTISGINYQRDLQFGPYEFDNLASVPDISNEWMGGGRVKNRRRRY